MMLGISTTSCEDMLSPDSERHAYTVAEDSLYSYWGILKSLQNVAERYVILNECRGDLVDGSSFVSDTIAPILRFGMNSDAEKYKDGACAYLRISDYYHVINSCNAYIAKCDTTITTGTDRKYMIKEYAQVQAIRAWVYMQLFYAYGPDRVPFYTQPMLTTDDINNFIANENYPKITVSALVEELAPDLEKMAEVERAYGYPEYLSYGDGSHFVCHSSRCMFPVSIVLGDLYLLQASVSQAQTDYMKAAAAYYKFLNSRYGGPLSVYKSICYANLDDSRDTPLYSMGGTVPTIGSSTILFEYNPFTEESAASNSVESITCIPSNRGKLEGKVLTDISRLFGFEAEMRTSGGESASASVTLNRNYERQLLPSRGYEALCDSQNYEIYLGRNDGSIYIAEAIETMPGVGDARRAWIYDDNGSQWTFRVGDDRLYGKMVHKQNPNGFFTSTYPVVYRKGSVWLRFAEALNGAGFPSYAFAVLKTGLCAHPDWFPTNPAVNPERRPWTPMINPRNLYDYPVTDTLFRYVDVISGKFIPVDGTLCGTRGELIDAVLSYFHDEYQASLDSGNPMDAERGEEDILLDNIEWAPKDASSFGNAPVDNVNAACYYLDRREVAVASNYSFLDFSQTYLRGLSSSVSIPVKEQGKMFDGTSSRFDQYPVSPNNDERYTIGVHQRGCGLIYPYDPIDLRSSYNYVDQVAKKIKKMKGIDVTKEEIYSGQYDEEVKYAVEDLIVDEMALELAFEGSRFSDLCRVAMHRGEDYLAERVAKRSGTENSSLRAWLRNKNNWWLPIPEEE